jgi:hypothetical protein
MSQRNVASIVDKLLTDPELRDEFALDPVRTIAELHMLGFLLSSAEIDAFLQTDVRSCVASATSFRIACTERTG